MAKRKFKVGELVVTGGEICVVCELFPSGKFLMYRLIKLENTRKWPKRQQHNFMFLVPEKYIEPAGTLAKVLYG